MQFAIWTKHPGDLLGEAIDFMTHGTAQHAGFIRGNGLIHEAYLPKVRDRAIVEVERPFLKLFTLEGMTALHHLAFERFFDANIAAQTKYSIEDLFRFELNIPMPDEKHTICSRYVIHGCMTLLPDTLWPLKRVQDDQVSPRDLYISPKFLPS